ncbi:hypothetical protein BLNAU_22828 [Blattamonas nauphoetae]|uniref:Uncharacterized protein n=1 Tax=Blattamonas nauphoetae TaxID=2049346 RepID=A0ABQ9WRZ3_9EUKA|nr:hypothetical protein BLNAU_22828 [Blattamonas nauphoetae]
MTSLESKSDTAVEDSLDCSAFLNWDKSQTKSEHEMAVVFRDLVAIVKSKPALTDTLEVKAMNFLVSVRPYRPQSADVFLSSLASFSDESLTNFVQSMVVLISSASRIITTPAMAMLHRLFTNCSLNVCFTLVKADLIAQLFLTLNPQSVSLTEPERVHTLLIEVIGHSFHLTTPGGLATLEIEDHDGQQAVHEIVLMKVLTPSEKYICHMCANRNSLVDGGQSDVFMALFARLLRLPAYCQPTMDFVLTLPVFLAIPSCLTLIENERPVYSFLNLMVYFQQEWNDLGGDVRLSGNTILRCLRMEGFDDVIEQRLQNDRKQYLGPVVADYSIKINNLHGMNVPPHVSPLM